MKRKVIAALLMTMSLTVGSAGSVFAMSADKYSDVPANSQVFDAVATVTDKNIVDGLSDTEYGVEEGVTRGQFVSALYNMKLNLPVTGSHDFTDIEGREDTAAIKWADDLNLFDGLKDDFFQNNKFEPDKELTREEASVILYNYGRVVDSLNMSEGVGVTTGFNDTTDAPVSTEYVSFMNWAVGNDMLIGDDLLTGEAENSLRPTEVLNKAELAEMLTQYINLRNDQKQESADAAQVATNAVNKATSNNASSNQNQQEETHTHNLKPNMVTKESKEEGHWEQELVKEAYDEEVTHPAEYEDIWIVDKEAEYEKTWIVDKEEVRGDKWVVDKEAVYETVHHPAETHEEQQWVVDKEAWTETIEHPAETHEEQQWVVDKEAWTETIEHPAETHEEQQWVVDQEAWDEQVIVGYRTVCNKCGQDFTNKMEHYNTYGCDSSLGYTGNVPVYETVHHPEEGHWETVTIIDKEAWTETINHPEEGHYETVTVIDKEAWTETIEHPEEGHYETVTIVDKEAWDEEVLVSPEEGHWEYDVVLQPEEGHFEDVLVSEEEGHWETQLVKEEWTETIHHDAEYKDVWVVDKEATTETVQDGMICIDCGAVVR